MYTQTKSYRKTKLFTYNGMHYDSRKEAGEVRFFQSLLDQGKIKSLHEQVLIEFYMRARVTREKDTGVRTQGDPIIQSRVRINEIYRYEIQPDFFTKKLSQFKIDLVIIHNGELDDDDLVEFIEVKGREDQNFRKNWDLLEWCFGMDDRYKLRKIK